MFGRPFLSGPRMTAPAPAADPAALFEGHRRLAFFIAARFARSYPWLADDFESDALLTLWLVACRPIPAGAEFSTYAGAAVRRACCDRVRAERRHRRVDAGEFDPLGQVADGSAEVGAALEYQEQIDRARALVAALPADRRELVERVVIGGETSDAVGAARGVSGSAVRDQVRRVLGGLRAAAGQ